MDTYINGIQKISETITAAPYPASSTALIIPAVSSLFSSNSTCILFVSRFTLTFSTPVSLLTLFSTWEEQAEQVMPVTSNLSFMYIVLSCYVLFLNIRSSAETSDITLSEFFISSVSSKVRTVHRLPLHFLRGYPPKHRF